LKADELKKNKNDRVKEWSFSEPVGVMSEIVIPGVQGFMLNQIIGSKKIFDTILKQAIVDEDLLKHKDSV
jgi:hypothetical protein